MQGQPVIASIAFDKDSFDDSPATKETDGHLIVIRGFTPDGKVIVNDPASRRTGNGALYPRPDSLTHGSVMAEWVMSYARRPIHYRQVW